MACTIRRFVSVIYNSVQRHNAILQQRKLNVEFAGQQRYFFIKDDAENQRTYNQKSDVRMVELFTKMFHWRILTEREQGEPPKGDLTLSMRKKILELESSIAPELEDPKNVIDDYFELPKPLSYEKFPLYTKTKWLLILQKQDHPTVTKLIELMETANVPQDVFCQTLGKFSFVPLENIFLYARPLTEFTLDEILEHCLHRHFNEENHQNPDLAIKSITHVLMKIKKKPSYVNEVMSYFFSV